MIFSSPVPWFSVHAFCGTGDENNKPTGRSAGNYYILLYRERHTRRLTCIASDVRDRARNWGQGNVTNIYTGSSARRIIFKRPQCMYKSEQRYINENLLTRNARGHTNGMSLVILKRL